PARLSTKRWRFCPFPPFPFPSRRSDRAVSCGPGPKPPRHPRRGKTMTDRKLHIGTFLVGIHAGHWRDSDTPADAVSNIQSFIKFAQIAEAAKFDFGFIADSAYINRDSAWALLSRLEPITALSALSTVTTHLGLAGTVATSYSNPFEVPRQSASLDGI